MTLLALGNGAPDLSACIAAVSSGRYKLALGALLGELPPFASVPVLLHYEVLLELAAGRLMMFSNKDGL